MSWKFSQTMWTWGLTCLFLRYLLVKFSQYFSFSVASKCIACQLFQAHFVDCTSRFCWWKSFCYWRSNSCTNICHWHYWGQQRRNCSSWQWSWKCWNPEKVCFCFWLKSFMQLYLESVCFITDYTSNCQMFVILLCLMYELSTCAFKYQVMYLTVSNFFACFYFFNFNCHIAIQARFGWKCCCWTLS